MIAATTVSAYRRLWQYLNYPMFLHNLLYIPSGGVDDTIAELSTVNKNQNIYVSLYKEELANTAEIQKFIAAGIKICNASDVSDATVLTLPEFVTLTSAHHDLQDILRTNALSQ